jgi:hypothetical protein
MRTGAPPLHMLEIELEIDDCSTLVDSIARGVENHGK